MFFLVIEGCTFHNEEDYFEELPCDSSLVDTDTISVTYNDLSYIFNGSCVQCHNIGFTNAPGIVFNDYDDVVSSIETGKVIPAIKHETVQMPKNQQKLSDCEIQLIEVWINRGMPK